MTTISRELRRKKTPAEEELWERLRNRQLGGYKIRRQQPLSSFVVDFYCKEKKLGIEIDGSVHQCFDQIIYDHERQKKLEKMGITILRFSNTQIFCNIDDVVMKILQTLNSL